MKSNGIDIYRGRLTNNASGVIEINRLSSGFSLYTNQGSEAFNYGVIKIGNVATVRSGLYLELNTRFVNYSNSLLEINGIATFGNAITTIGHEQFPARFINDGTVRAGNLSSIYEGLNLNGTTTIGSSGLVEINNTSISATNTRGMLIGGSCTNSGTLKIGNLSSVSPYGLLVGSNGTFTNNSGASVEIDRIPNNGNGERAVALSSGGTFSNNGNLKIGTLASVRLGIFGYSGTVGTFNNTGTITFANILLQGIGANTIVKNNSGGLIQTPIGGNLDIFGTINNNSNATVLNNGILTLSNGFGVLNNNGIVKGNGTIVNNSNFINNINSTIAPGTSAGTLTITGSLNLGSTIYECEINGTANGNFDKLAVSGNANLTNATLQVIWGFTPVVGNTFTILTCGSRTGQFASVNIPPISGLNYNIVYNTTSVIIQMTAVPTCPTPQNIVIQNITSSGAAMSWDAATGATGYEVLY